MSRQAHLFSVPYGTPVAGTRNKIAPETRRVSRTVDNGGSVDTDDDLLINMGYKPELARVFGYMSAFGQAWGSQGLAPSIAGSLIFALGSGGSVASIWTWIVGCTLLIPAALALGELASSMPTSGGIYFWTAKLTPVKYRLFLCWVTAYMITLGYIMCYASTVYLTATMFLATVSMAMDGSYVPSKYNDYGIYLVFCIVTCLLTSFSSKVLAALNNFYVVFQLMLCFALILAMAAATPPEYTNTADFVFVDFQNTGNWANDGWAWCLGFLTPVWVVSGFESASTLAEEASNASMVVPIAMIASLLASLVLGTAIIITLLFTMGTDIPGLLGSSFGQPVGQMLYNSMGKVGATTLFFFLFLGFIFNCSNLAFAASREMFAFSRDDGLPWSSFLRVLTTWKAPVRCVWAVGFISMITGLLMLADIVFISAVFNIAIIGMYWGYITPIVSRLIWRDFQPAVFYVGKFSVVNSYFAVVWMAFVILILLFPTYETPGLMQMNYAIVVVGFVMVFCSVYYYWPKSGGKTFFQGPVRTLDRKLDIALWI